MASTLQMTFTNEANKKVSLTINDPRVDLTEVEVKNAMNEVIAQNVFTSSFGDLVAISGARIIDREVTELDLTVE